MDVYRSIASFFITGIYTYGSRGNIIPSVILPKGNIFCFSKDLQIKSFDWRSQLSSIPLDLSSGLRTFISDFIENKKKDCCDINEEALLDRIWHKGCNLIRTELITKGSLSKPEAKTQLVKKPAFYMTSIFELPFWLAQTDGSLKNQYAKYWKIFKKAKTELIILLIRTLIPIKKGISDSVGRQSSVNCPVKTLHRNSANLFDNRSSQDHLLEGKGAFAIVILHFLILLFNKFKEVFVFPKSFFLKKAVVMESKIYGLLVSVEKKIKN